MRWAAAGHAGHGMLHLEVCIWLCGQWHHRSVCRGQNRDGNPGLGILAHIASISIQHLSLYPSLPVTLQGGASPRRPEGRARHGDISGHVFQCLVLRQNYKGASCLFSSVTLPHCPDTMHLCSEGHPPVRV